MFSETAAFIVGLASVDWIWPNSLTRIGCRPDDTPSSVPEGEPGPEGGLLVFEEDPIESIPNKLVRLYVLARFELVPETVEGV